MNVSVSNRLMHVCQACALAVENKACRFPDSLGFQIVLSVKPD